MLVSESRVPYPEKLIQEVVSVANIGEPQRIIIAEPVFEPIPQDEPSITEPVETPEEVPVGDER